jgi:hypothetical protein
MMLTTTLNAIRAHDPCDDGWQKLLAHLGKTGPDDEPVTLATILDSNGLDDALWALRCVTGHDRAIRLYAVWCARQVQHLMTDSRSLRALDVAERHADGLTTNAELAAARAAAWAAAGDAARAAAGAAAWAAAWAAAGNAAGDAARDAAGAAAGDAAWDAQAAEFRRRFCTEGA